MTESKATTPETHVILTKDDVVHLSKLLEEVRRVYASAEHAGVMLQLGHYRRLSVGQDILSNVVA